MNKTHGTEQGNKLREEGGGKLTLVRQGGYLYGLLWKSSLSDILPENEEEEALTM